MNIVGYKWSNWDIASRIFLRFSQLYPYKKNMSRWWEKPNPMTDEYHQTYVRWGVWCYGKKINVIKNVIEALKTYKTPYQVYPPSLKQFIALYDSMDKAIVVERKFFNPVSIKSIIEECLIEPKLAYRNM